MKMSLEEATMKALLGELEDKESKDDVEGIVDGIMVVIDPEITPDEYEEVIDNAQEILEDTPEGEVPFNDQYVGEYLLTCPICGSSFINKDVLNVGDSCPICTEVPEQGFILNGQVATQEDVELQNDIQDEKDKEENDDVNVGFEEVEEEPISEEDVEEVQEEIVASEVQRTADNKLEESRLEGNKEIKNESDEDKNIDLKIKEHEKAIEDIKNEWNEFIKQAKQSKTVGEAFEWVAGAYDIDDDRYEQKENEFYAENNLESAIERAIIALNSQCRRLCREEEYEIEKLKSIVKSELQKETKNVVKRPEQLNEAKEESYGRFEDGKLIPTGLFDQKSEDILKSVLMQLSDGIWQNNAMMRRYWKYADIVNKNGEIFIQLSRDYNSGFYNMINSDVRKFFAKKIEQIVKTYIKDYKDRNPNIKWDMNCIELCKYLGEDNITIQDAYKVYNTLLNRSATIKTEGNKHISAEEKLEAIYDDYKRQGFEKNYWTDLLNIIDNFDALDRWFNASYPEDEDLYENKELKVEDKAFENIDDAILDSVEKVCKEWNAPYKRYTNLEMNDCIKFKDGDRTLYVGIEELYNDDDLEENWEKLEEE